jgi:hypothetical protein
MVNDPPGSIKGYRRIRMQLKVDLKTMHTGSDKPILDQKIFSVKKENTAMMPHGGSQSHVPVMGRIVEQLAMARFKGSQLCIIGLAPDEAGFLNSLILIVDGDGIVGIGASEIPPPPRHTIVAVSPGVDQQRTLIFRQGD